VVGPNGGVVHQTRSKEITTFSINDGAEVVAVELVGRQAYFRTIPVADLDEVEVTGIWKPRAGCLRALEVRNLKTGTVTRGRRWLSV
jgi:hypothetical protein